MINNYLKKITFFILYLIISLPFISSASLAAISSSVYGKGNIENIIASENDFIEVVANVDGLVLADDIRFLLDTTEIFDECVYDGSNSLCKKTLETIDRIADKHVYKIYQYDSNNVIIGSYENSLYIDGTSPIINSISHTLKNGLLSISYSVSDSACDNCDNLCSGFSKLNLYIDDIINDTISIEDNSCSKTGAYEKSFNDINNDEIYVCISIIDRVGMQSQKKCLQTEIDTIIPELSSNILVLDENLNSIEYISITQKNATIILNVTEKNLDEVYGNFSELHDIYEIDYENLLGTCTPINEDLNSCQWNIYVRGTAGSKSIIINTQDKSGNLANKTYTLNWFEDTTEPEIIAIYNNPLVRDLEIPLYLNIGINQIKLVLANDGSGYKNKDLFMEFGSFSTQTDPYQASSCNLINNEWICEFDLIPNDGDESRISVLSISKDDSGNQMTKAFYTTAIMDSITPEVKEINTENICPYAGQDMALEIIIEDDSPITLTIQPKTITNSNKTYVADCQELSTTQQICKLTIDDLVSTAITETLNLNISDAAMNSKIENHLVNVCESVAGESLSYISVLGIPLNKVDLRALSFIDIPILAELEVSLDSGVEIIESAVSCGSEFESVHLIGKTTTNPTLSMKVKRTSNATNVKDKITANCTYSAIIKKGTQVYTEPASKEFSINSWSTYNNPLGTIEESITSKITSIEEQMKQSDEEIEEWETWNKWMGMFCVLAETLAMLDVVLGIVKTVVYGVAYALCSAKITFAAGAALWTKICNYITIYDNFVNDFIWTPGGTLKSFAMIPKTFCMIYSCKLCTFEAGAGMADLTGIDSGIWSAVYSIGAIYSLPGTLSRTLSSIGGGAMALGGNMDWERDSKPTVLNYALSGFQMDPYRSIHAAASCLCIPGIIYNLKKEKQIKCMYKSCIEKNAQLGLPLNVCDEAYQVQECLYVDGAQWKLFGMESMGFFLMLFGAMMNYAGVLMAGMYWQKKCGGPLNQYNNKNGCNGCPNINILSKQNVLCHISGSALMLAEIGEFAISPDMDKYSADLEGDTVC